MPRLRGLTREPSRGNPRARRNSQSLAMDVQFIGGDSVITLDGAGILQVTLASSGGLEAISNELTVKLATTPGLVLSSSGLSALVQGVLTVDASGIAVSIGDGLQNDSGDLAVLTGNGLTTSGGAVIAALGNGLAFDTGLIAVDLATDPGLEFSGGDLRVKISGGGGIARDSNGLSFGILTTKGDLLAFDTGLARLGVGSDGQVLTADSAEATGLKWASAAAASVPLTTKGDLLVYDTDLARLGVGSDGQVLTADSAEASGLKWAAASAASLPTTTKGDIIVHNGTSNVRLGVGTDGQVIKANSAVAAGIEWAAESGGGASSPLTTKGDIWVYTTDDARLGVGSDGQYLVADSGEAAGMKWTNRDYTSRVFAAGTPVAYFPMDEASGNLADLGSAGLTGTVNGSPTYGVENPIVGEDRTCMNFAGSGNYVDCGVASAIAITPNADPITIACWVRIDSTSSNWTVVKRGDNSGNNQYVMYITTGGALGHGIGNTFPSAGSGLVDGDWHHIALTSDGSTMIAYIDGVQVNSAAVSTSSLGGTIKFIAAGGITSGGTIEPYHGDLAHVVVYLEQLSATKIKALAQPFVV